MAERNALFDVFNAKCTPQTIVMVGEKFDFKELKKVPGYWASVAMHPGEARSRFLSKLGAAALYGSGVRWWLHWEKGVQLHEVGIENLNGKVISYCAEKKISEGFTKNVKGFLSETSNLAKVTVQVSTKTDAGLPFLPEQPLSLRQQGP